MLDLIFITAITGLYLLSVVYVVACDKLRKGAKSE